MGTEDYSLLKIPAASLIKGRPSRDNQGQAARLANQFLRQNRGLLHDFEISGNINYDGASVDIQLITGGKVGALPLSPTVRPPGLWIGDQTAFWLARYRTNVGGDGMENRTEPLPLPLLPRSDRKFPLFFPLLFCCGCKNYLTS